MACHVHAYARPSSQTSLFLHAGEEDGGQATHVRKVASAPDELDKLKARSMNGGIMQGEQDPTLQEGGPLALPPSACRSPGSESPATTPCWRHACTSCATAGCLQKLTK